MLQDVGSLNEFGQLCLFPKKKTRRPISSSVQNGQYRASSTFLSLLRYTCNGMPMAEKNILLVQTTHIIQVGFWAKWIVVILTSTCEKEKFRSEEYGKAAEGGKKV